MANTIKLSDYTQPHFWTESIDLDIDIKGSDTKVYAKTLFIPNESNPGDSVLLNGVDLDLLEIKINGSPLEVSQYIKEDESIKLTNLKGKFTLETVVRIDPNANFSGEGIYKSGHIYCTQCEAEGFRRITYYQDRPDVMAMFKTTLRADKSEFPYLLSNGNPVDQGELEDGRHFVTWEDPHKKPCYLFAAVAGDLALIKDKFTTKSGREVSLEIYVDKGNEDKCDHAMISLINSMKWDEEVFGLEYDLDIYMIVAVDSFNMGAMENKGLNIFNSAYVLAKKETATDSDFQGIESVIGHEYFHNWTGNRVTCRDWFQLTLKEGLTVFRDQEFSSDMLSRPVKRIEDVRGLKMSQFLEDAGPLSHPIKPKEYSEINNFYTATVYEKGAEVIRMIHTLIGKDNFRKGMDLYFKRHDGEAVTTEDFVAAMSDASGVNLDQFKVWYDQNGTPKLDVQTEYNLDAKTLKIEITQNVKTNNEKYNSLHMPFKMAAFLEDGSQVTLPQNGEFELKDLKTSFVFENIPSKPILSLNREFAAPVIVNHSHTSDELAVLMANETDTFNQYNAAQSLFELEVESLCMQSTQGKKLALSDKFCSSFQSILDNKTLDNAFKALLITPPSINELINKKETYDFDHLPVAINSFKELIGVKFASELEEIFHLVSADEEFSISTEAMGKRALKSLCLMYLFRNKSDNSLELTYTDYKNANNMTDEFSALAKLISRENKYREQVSKEFYNKWKNETLVMQKWMAAHAQASDCTPEKLIEITKLEVFDAKIPNHLRAIYSQFAANNIVQFNKEDGSGYKFYGDIILETDKYNPQIAAGLCKRMNYLKKLTGKRAELFRVQLERIKEQADLSTDVREIVLKNLGQ